MMYNGAQWDYMGMIYNGAQWDCMGMIYNGAQWDYMGKRVEKSQKTACFLKNNGVLGIYKEIVL